MEEVAYSYVRVKDLVNIGFEVEGIYGLRCRKTVFSVYGIQGPFLWMFDGGLPKTDSTAPKP